MSKIGYISRYLLIVKKLKACPYSTFEELRDYIDQQLEYLQMQDESIQIGFSKRTLQRDIREIRMAFGVDIEYSTKQKGYFITQADMESMNFQRMMEAFDIFTTLNLAKEFTPYIHLEQRKPQNTEKLYELLLAIKKKHKINFHYCKFWEEKGTGREAAPYALKEYKNRWYVLAKDDRDGKIKSFALDRMSDLLFTNISFEVQKDFAVDKEFQYSFGVISPSDEKKEPQEIILSFTKFQGKYIKTLPLHHTQEILTDDPGEVKVKLKLFVTHDFIMELLSFGENVEVLKPENLKYQIKKRHQSSADQYQ